VGPVVGIAGSCLLIWFSGRFLKINLAVPMTSSLVTGVVGLMLASPLKDQSVVHMVGILAAVAGGVIGLLGQFTKKNNVESNQDKRESDGRTSLDDTLSEDRSVRNDDKGDSRKAAE
jgi:hypothetical protein